MAVTSRIRPPGPRPRSRRPPSGSPPLWPGHPAVEVEPDVEPGVGRIPGEAGVVTVAGGHQPAGAADPAHLGQGADRIGQVLEHLVGVDDVEGGVGEVEVRRRRPRRSARWRAGTSAAVARARSMTAAALSTPTTWPGPEAPGQVDGDGPGPQPTSRMSRPGAEAGQEVGGGVLGRPPPVGAQDALVVAVGVAVLGGSRSVDVGCGRLMGPACAVSVSISKEIYQWLDIRYIECHDRSSCGRSWPSTGPGRSPTGPGSGGCRSRRPASSWPAWSGPWAAPSSSGRPRGWSPPAGPWPSTPRRPSALDQLEAVLDGTRRRTGGPSAAPLRLGIDGRVLLVARPAPDGRHRSGRGGQLRRRRRASRATGTGRDRRGRHQLGARATVASRPWPSGRSNSSWWRRPAAWPGTPFVSLAELGDWLVGQAVGGLQPGAAHHPAVLADPSRSTLLGPVAPGGPRSPGRDRRRGAGDGLQHPAPVRLCRRPRRAAESSRCIPSPISFPASPGSSASGPGTWPARRWPSSWASSTGDDLRGHAPGHQRERPEQAGHGGSPGPGGSRRGHRRCGPTSRAGTPSSPADGRRRPGAAALESDLESALGNRVPVLVRTREELGRRDRRPIPSSRRGEDLGSLHVTFLGAVPDADAVEAAGNDGPTTTSSRLSGARSISCARTATATPNSPTPSSRRSSARGHDPELEDGHHAGRDGAGVMSPEPPPWFRGTGHHRNWKTVTAGMLARGDWRAASGPAGWIVFRFGVAGGMPAPGRRARGGCR